MRWQTERHTLAGFIQRMVCAGAGKWDLAGENEDVRHYNWCLSHDTIWARFFTSDKPQPIYDLSVCVCKSITVSCRGQLVYVNTLTLLFCRKLVALMCRGELVYVIRLTLSFWQTSANYDSFNSNPPSEWSLPQIWMGAVCGPFGNNDHCGLPCRGRLQSGGPWIPLGIYFGGGSPTKIV